MEQRLVSRDVADVSIVIPTYNVRHLLDACLKSIDEAKPDRSVEIIVIDNDSRDGTVDYVRENHPNVQVIANSVNVGFGQAANQGFARSSGQFILLLNPDTTIDSHTIDGLVGVFDSEPAIGVAGPLIFYPDGTVQPTRRGFPSPVVAMIESTVVQPWFQSSGVLRGYYRLDRSNDRQDVDWLVGACLMILRAVIEEVHGFDVRFFMYSEELDWCRRVKAAGWRIVFSPSATIVHHEGRSSEQNLVLRATNFQESKARYFEKYYGDGCGRALRIVLLANSCIELTIEILKLAVGHRPQLRVLRVRSLLSVIRNQVSLAGLSS